MSNFQKLIFVYCLLSFLYIPFVFGLTLTGDEFYYYNTSKYIIEFLSSCKNLDKNGIINYYNLIIDKGFYIPTTSLIISLFIYLKFKLILIRLMFFFINLILSLLILKKIHCINGINKAIIFSVIIFVFPIYNLFSFTFWGDAIAGKLLLLSILYFNSNFNSNIKLREVFLFSLLTSSMFYFRGNLILVLPVFILFYFIVFKNELLISKIKNIAIFSLVNFVIIMIWPLMLFFKFGGLFFPTTSTDTSVIILYANDKLLEEIENTGGNNNGIGKKTYLYYENKSKIKSITFSQAIKEDKLNAIINININSFFNVFKVNVQSFFSPNIFLNNFLKNRFLKNIFYLLNLAVWFILLSLFLFYSFINYSDKSKRLLIFIFFILFTQVLWYFNPRHLILFIPILIYSAINSGIYIKYKH